MTSLFGKQWTREEIQLYVPDLSQLAPIRRSTLREGRAEGIEQGRAEGAVQGQAALIVRMLRSKFGALDAEVEARIQHASIAELEMIGDRLLVARTLQDALAPRSIPM